MSEQYDRKGAGDESSYTEMRFHPLIENSSDIITILNEDGTVRYINPAVKRVLGYEPEELVGRRAFDLLHPEDAERTVAEFGRAMTHPGVHWAAVENRLKHKDGSWRHVHGLATNLLDDPAVRGIVINSRDLTERVRVEQALRESEARLRSVVENTSDVVTILDAEGNFLYENPAVERVFGYRPGERIGKNAFDYIHPEDRQLAAEIFGKSLATPGTTGPFEFRLPHKDGSWRYLEHSIDNLLGDPEVGKAVIVSRNVTRRKQSEERLHLQARLLNEVGQAVIATDLGGRVLYWNRCAERLYGWSAEEAMGRRAGELIVSEEFLGRAAQIMEKLRAGRSWSGEFEVRRKDGTTFPALVTDTPIHDDGGNLIGIIGVSTDITERKEMEERLRFQAFHDPLTDLPNRHLFVDRLGQALRRTKRREKRRVAVLFMDLDGFKVINDSLGHDVGDRLLVAVAERLGGSLRPEDTLARFGSDEFVVLVEDVEGPDDAVRVARRVVEGLREPFFVEGWELYVKASMGVALGGKDTRSPEDLLRDADTAMCRTKEEGSDYKVFDESMYERAMDRLELENDLRRAIEQEEFVVHYQPIVNLLTDELWGMEALVRWEHPERGLLDPDEFVPLAEQSGLIVPMGEMVLGEACCRAVEWQRQFPRTPPLAISVNLSGRQLRRPDLQEVIGQALEESGLSASSLSLDITEGVYISALDANTAAFECLKALGIRISLDDFGTGYSSLSYIKRLPADILKIDKSFIRGFGVEVEDTAIVQTIIGLTHIIGMEVVAEGVEIEEQAVLLEEMGCDFAQGFYFSRPLPPEEMPGFLLR